MEAFAAILSEHWPRYLAGTASRTPRIAEITTSWMVSQVPAR